MAERAVSYVLGAVVCAGIAAGVLSHSASSKGIGFSEYTGTVVAQTAATTTPILFVGDVMLARYVERHMLEKGADYPFTKVADTLKTYSAVVGNFEAAIPPVHVPTKPRGMVFSVDAANASALKQYGFTHLSLANNHTLDFGEGGFRHTNDILRGFGFSVGGTPEKVTKEEVLIIDAGGLRVGVIPVYAVFAIPDMAGVADTIASLASSTDAQIIYVHWGDEYELLNNKAQQALAHAFIDAGADAVIGHHPHVVQNIEVYNNAPIFYSLGNFIFDQYWNEDVQSGLALELYGTGHALRFNLIPLESKESVPFFLEGERKVAALEALAARSDASLKDALTLGIIETVPGAPSSVLVLQPGI